MTDVEKQARKRLNLDDEALLSPGDMHGKGTLMITDGQEQGARDRTDDLENEVITKATDKNKRQKGDSANSSASNSVSAGSLEGYRREQ
jgi:hypothetical protein